MAAGLPEQIGVFSKLDKLYFGSVACHFAQVPGAAYGVEQDGSSLHAGGEEETKNARLHQLPQSHLGEAYEKLVVPGIPAVELVWQSKGDEREAELRQQMPAFFRSPLQKTEGGPIVGAQSGIRSGIIKASDGKFYRLKGCGNNYGGFPTRSFSSLTAGDCIEIRGCTFAWTCHLEEYMTGLIGRAVGPDFSTANIPCGWFVYDVPNDPFPLVPKYCALFECLGDKRLGDHVLLAFERLLPSMLDAATVDAKATLPFPETRWDGDHVLPTGIAAECEMRPYIDIVGLQVPEHAPAARPADLEEEWHDVWDQSVAVLSAYLASHAAGSRPVGSIIALLYWRFGWEIGHVVRQIHARNISWGTYIDELGVHCNAHVNNLVLLSEDSANPLRPLLAPLDFDMAFHKEIFLRLDTDDPVLTESTFNEWITLEKRGMECCLAGSSLNTGTAALETLEGGLVDYREALRDTACHAYLASLNQEAPDSHPLTAELSPVVHAVIRLALLNTLKQIA